MPRRDLARHSAKKSRPVAAQASDDVMALLQPGQSIELLKELHILTREGRLNQDSRRKLKQVFHLYQLIVPILREIQETSKQTGECSLSLADHGAGKSYLGFILYDLYFASQMPAGHIYGVETRAELVERAQALAQRLGFARMSFVNTTVAQATQDARLPEHIDVVTALHACDSATDDAIDFALHKHARAMVLVPCCQAEVASALRKNKAMFTGRATQPALAQLWRHPLHAREMGSHLTNVLRCLYLQACGYQVTVTELVGWEHSMKNELILARYTGHQQRSAAQQLLSLLEQFGLQLLDERFPWLKKYHPDLCGVGQAAGATTDFAQG